MILLMCCYSCRSERQQQHHHHHHYTTFIIFIWTDFDREHNPHDDEKINFHNMHVAGARIVFTGFEEFAWIH